MSEQSNSISVREQVVKAITTTLLFALTCESIESLRKKSHAPSFGYSLLAGIIAASIQNLQLRRNPDLLATMCTVGLTGLLLGGLTIPAANTVNSIHNSILASVGGAAIIMGEELVMEEVYCPGRHHAPKAIERNHQQLIQYRNRNELYNRMRRHAMGVSP